MKAEVEVEVLDDVLVISYRGKIEFGDPLYILSKTIRDNYPAFKNLVFNLHAVELHPADIPILLVHYLSSYASGYRIRLCSASEAVHNVLESTRVVEVFQLPLDENRQESIDALHRKYSVHRNMRTQVAAV